jgi:hypothetical protein
MSQTIASLPPPARYIDYSAEIPGLESETIESVNLWAGEDGLSFSDLLDVINPLQHLPVISSIYRAVTGDEISLGARLLGGALFGGPIGIITAGANAAFEEISGGNIVEHAAALFEEITGTGDEKTQLALEPQTPKAGVVAATAPAVLPAHPRIPPDPAAINPPVKPPTITPIIPALPVPTNAAPSPLLKIDARRPQQGTVGLPAAVNIPSHNSIALFNGQSSDPTTRRISRSIMEGQRAQAQLLLSSLSGGGKNTDKENQARSGPETSPVQRAQRRQAQTAGQQPSLEAIRATANARSLIPSRQSAHPNLPPTGAPAAWFQQAMDRGLDKYQNTDNLRRVGQSHSAPNP